jgi:hypothetical protein
LAQSAARLVTSDEINRVRACASKTCRWLFIDASKNHSRRWCDMKICGNRMKARRFSARRAPMTRTPYEAFSLLDLGPGGYARAAARDAKTSVKTAFQRKIRR